MILTEEHSDGWNGGQMENWILILHLAKANMIKHHKAHNCMQERSRKNIPYPWQPRKKYSQLEMFYRVTRCPPPPPTSTNSHPFKFPMRAFAPAHINVKSRQTVRKTANCFFATREIRMECCTNQTHLRQKGALTGDGTISASILSPFSIGSQLL